MEYELLFFTTLANEESVPEIKREIEEIITGRGGKILNDFSDIGKRKFAHPIKKQTHGFFSFCRFTLDEKENIPELNRRLILNEKIMRHLIVRADEIGKPINAQIIRTSRPEESAAKPMTLKTVAPSESIAKPETEEKKPAEDKSKVGMANLDEKLDEILTESPE
jgi:small subunit ribosomal protein S6